ncbi:hypothetical protein SUGI_0502560 [Cryptomeria japonica]|nr:hypothetical protein SUGI_0502560 [Cryptomeria japonica]
MVAASLECKRLSSEWQSKLQHIKEASSTNDPIMQILQLSYDSLPAHLKPCFAFLSFFPEDELIESQYLINLWVEEGYIHQGEDQLEIGWTYISHLYNLCLLESAACYYGTGFQRRKLDTMYILHDLVLDLAISISKESKCAFSVEEAFKKGTTRVLMVKKSIGNGDVHVMASNGAYSASRLRTFSFSQNKSIQNIPATLLRGARVLLILDLSRTSISSLPAYVQPAYVENLKLLRFLNLSETNIAEVPKYVRSNKSLRFLDLSNCSGLERLPNWIGELNCLEHLDISGFRGFMPKEISKLCIFMSTEDI